MLTIENLEMKCEDLEKKINDLISQNESLERQNSRLKKSNDERQFLANKEASISRSSSTRRVSIENSILMEVFLRHTTTFYENDVFIENSRNS